MHPAAVDHLRCPYCAADLARADDVLACHGGHRFDLARQGYVNLLAGNSPHRGDDAAMVTARDRFLAAGHFAPIRTAIVDLLQGVGHAGGAIVELGAGTGYHLAGVLDALPGRAGLALDASRYACRRAARAHPRIGAVVCDVWGDLPVRSGTAAAVLSVFAPRNGVETRRILQPGGRVVVVAPTTDHLRELVEALGLVAVDTDKRERLVAELSPHLVCSTENRLDQHLRLSRDAVRDLVAMGPSAHHLTPDVLDSRLTRLRFPATVSVSVTVARYDRDSRGD